jgi:hypothetical protein
MPPSFLRHVSQAHNSHRGPRRRRSHGLRQEPGRVSYQLNWQPRLRRCDFFALPAPPRFVERLWWTVKHEWIYLRPAANGIEQKRSLAEFFDWYNLRRPHQALGWRTPDEAYLGQSTAATALAA